MYVYIHINTCWMHVYLLEVSGIELTLGAKRRRLEGEGLLSLRVEGRVLDERVDEHPAAANMQVSHISQSIYADHIAS
jgi:hypothetical protein